MTQSSLTIRPAVPEDIPAVLAIETDSFPFDAWSEEAFSAAFEHEFCGFCVVCLDGEIAGYFVATAFDGLCALDNIAVRRELRKGGIGDALLQAVVGFAREKDCRSVALELRLSNAPAAALYIKHGFVKRAVRKRIYTDPVEDGIVMTLEV